MIHCQECGYQATRVGIKGRCVRCGGYLDDASHEAPASTCDPFDHSAYRQRMIYDGWTCLPHQHVETSYARLD
jgi:threonine synthase